MSGSTCPAIASPFPMDVCGIPSTPAPVLVKVRVHPLRNFASSSENYSVFIGRHPKMTSTPTQVSFLFATTTPGVHYRRSSNAPPNVPPSAFLTLSMVYSSQCTVGLFRPTATCRIRTSGVFPATQPSPTHRRLVPSCRSTSPSPRSKLPVPTR